PHLLIDHSGNAALNLSLIDGKVSSPDGDDPQVSGYLRSAARWRPGARLIVLARPEPEPPTERIFQSVLGLGLTLGIRLRTADRPRLPPAPKIASWRIQVLSAAEAEAVTGPVGAERAAGTEGAGGTEGAAGLVGTGLARRQVRFGPVSPSLVTAVAELQARFDSSLRRALAIGRLAPLPVPQQAAPVRIDLTTLEPSLERLSEAFPNTDIWLCTNLDGWSCFVGEPHKISVCGAAILEIVAQLVSG
ncbi:MAG TPA: hypothetical protein VLL08_11280, partial [Kineosporiaceae bacterium]|nr:hypothetical protein [Kineosporiaceae bacterium]